MESFTSQDTGIETVEVLQCPNLIRISLPYQDKLKSLDLTKVPKIQELYLQRCLSLKDLDLTGCSKLQIINVSNDSTINVKGLETCSSLHDLIAYNSNVNNVDFGKITTLVKLDLTNNKIENIDLSRNKNLEHLELSGNKLTSVDLSNQKGLKVLKMSYNQFKTLDLSNLENLQEVDVRKNQLVYFNINTKRLNNLDCSYNNLSIDQLIDSTNMASYVYSPQGPFPVKERIGVGEILDLSKMYIAKGVKKTESITQFTVVDANDKKLKEGQDYTFDKGNFVFKRPSETDLRIKLYTDAFPLLKGDSISISTPFKIVIAEEDPKENYNGLKDNAFNNCNILEQIIMPETIEFIGNSVFEGCSNLKAVIFTHDASKFGESTFPDQEGLKIYVEKIETKNYLDSKFAFKKTEVIVGSPESVSIPKSINKFSLIGNELCINSKEQAHIRIYNIDGTLMEEGLTDASNTYTAYLSSGFYIVEVNSNTIKIYIK